MLFLGIFDPTCPSFEDGELNELKVAVSRSEGDNRELRCAPHFALVTVPLTSSHGSFHVHDQPGTIGLVAGRPYIEKDQVKDASTVIDALVSGNNTVLASSRGSYSAVCYLADARRLVLCTDKVGVYPIYIARVDGRIYFASALRMLEAIERVPKRIAADRLFSFLGFDYCLARETVYSDIERMYGSELTVCSKEGQVQAPYWRWDAVPEREFEGTELEEAVHLAFMDAVAIRSGSVTTEFSFLSGGLDSRCIVAALLQLGKKTYTLNFAPEGSQDHFFGRLASRALGSTHYELALGKGSFPARQKAILDSWARAHPQLDVDLQPNRVWSGDGGSVGVGHVYLDNTFMQLLRQERILEACEHFIETNKCKVTLGMLKSEMRHEAEASPLRAMIREISSFACQDPAKAGLLFLLMNDQRQHLFEYFENLDLNRFEIVLPFFDCRLLEVLVAASIDQFLGHVFYHKWLSKFGPAISSIPWQTYPGHLSCPVVLDSCPRLRYQWDEDWFDKGEVQRKWLDDMKSTTRMLRSSHFDSTLLDKKRIWIAYLLTKMNIRDYKYILDDARRIASYSSACGRQDMAAR